MTKRLNLNELVLPHLRSAKPYVPGEQPSGEGWIKLNTNENPFPPSPHIADAITEASKHLAIYPNPSSSELRAVIGRLHGIDPANIVVGNGSDDILNLITRSFCSADSHGLLVEPGYSHYPVLIGLQGGVQKEIRFDDAMKLPVGEIVNSQTKVCFLTSPNAPTGVGFSTKEIGKVLEAYQGILVVDEAYADFAKEDAISLLADFDNLIITRTLSKSYALAGLRLGYAMASVEVVNLLNAIRDPYNVGALPQAAAIAALEDQTYYKGVIDKICLTRENFLIWLKKKDWFCYESQSNFLFFEPRKISGESSPDLTAGLFEFLHEKKILVRYFGNHELTNRFLRVSVGTQSQMNTLSEVLELWQKEK